MIKYINTKGETYYIKDTDLIDMIKYHLEPVRESLRQDEINLFQHNEQKEFPNFEITPICGEFNKLFQFTNPYILDEKLVKEKVMTCLERIDNE